MLEQQTIDIIISWVSGIFKILCSLVIRVAGLAIIIALAILILYALYLGLLCFFEFEKECKCSLGLYTKIIDKPKKNKKVKLNEDVKEERLF